MTSAAPNDGKHVCSVCKHSWVGPCVASNPLAELQPHLSSEGVVVFETNRTWELVSASKFVKQTKSQVVFLATVEQIGALNVTHRAAHGSKVEHRFEGSTKLLAELEQEYPRVFAEPEFPITEHRTPFSIPLVDQTVQPTRRKLYPLSSLEL